MEKCPRPRHPGGIYCFVFGFVDRAGCLGCHDCVPSIAIADNTAKDIELRENRLLDRGIFIRPRKCSAVMLPTVDLSIEAPSLYL